MARAFGRCQPFAPLLQINVATFQQSACAATSRSRLLLRHDPDWSRMPRMADLRVVKH
jgi:hypothetical protein